MRGHTVPVAHGWPTRVEQEVDEPQVPGTAGAGVTGGRDLGQSVSCDIRLRSRSGRLNHLISRTSQFPHERQR